jgi:hypothetical protein
MAFCQNCGSELTQDAKFCAKCGKEVGIVKQKQNNSDIIMKIFAVIGGITLLALIIILVKNNTLKNDTNIVISKPSTNVERPVIQNEINQNPKNAISSLKSQQLANKAFEHYLEQVFFKKHDRKSESINDNTEFKFGDINSDGKPDAIAIFTYSSYPGNAWTQNLAVFINHNDNEFEFLSDIETGSRQLKCIDLKSDIEITNSEVSCTESFWTNEDPGCCPSGKRKLKYVITPQGIFVSKG